MSKLLNDEYKEEQTTNNKYSDIRCNTLLKIKEPLTNIPIPVYIERNEDEDYSQHRLYNIFSSLSNIKTLGDYFYLVNNDMLHEEMLLFYFNFHTKYNINDIKPSTLYTLNTHFINYMKLKYHT